MLSNRITAWMASFALAFGMGSAVAADATKAPDQLIMEVSTDVLDAVKADKSIQTGDVQKITALVDAKVMPYVNFQRMTASAVGRNWRQATPEQKQRLQEDVVVRTEVRGKGDPIQLDYRLEKKDDGWRIYDVNVLGVWLVQNYTSSFAQEIGANGIDGLIAKLAERNKAAAGNGTKS